MSDSKNVEVLKVGRSSDGIPCEGIFGFSDVLRQLNLLVILMGKWWLVDLLVGRGGGVGWKSSRDEEGGRRRIGGAAAHLLD